MEESGVRVRIASGGYVLVDALDAPRVRSVRCTLSSHAFRVSPVVVAYVGKKRLTLARWIVGAGDGVRVTLRNGKPRDLRRANLAVTVIEAEPLGRSATGWELRLAERYGPDLLVRCAARGPMALSRCVGFQRRTGCSCARAATAEDARTLQEEARRCLAKQS